MPPPHEILGVPSTADAVQIRKAFFAAARACHPDKIPPGAAPELGESMHRRFVELHAAYETLMTAAESRGPLGVPCQMPEAFQVTREQLEEVRSNRREAEEHLLSLRRICHNVGVLDGEEFEMLKRSWRRAQRAVDSFVRQEAELRTYLNYANSLVSEREARAHHKTEEQEETVQQQPVRIPLPAVSGETGPQIEQNYDVFGVANAAWLALTEGAQSVGAAFIELADDAADFFRDAASWWQFATASSVDADSSASGPSFETATSGGTGL